MLVFTKKGHGTHAAFRLNAYMNEFNVIQEAAATQNHFTPSVYIQSSPILIT